MDRYVMLEIIGYGTYGVVYRGRNVETRELVAIKRIRIRSTSRGLSKSVTREIEALRQMPRHENIVQLRDFVEDRERHEVFFVLEFLDMDLRRYLDLTSYLATEGQQIKYFIYHILSGLNHCHTHNFVHRDLKPQNVLLDRRTGLLKIADFGLSRNYVSEPPETDPLTPDIATIWYRAPEVFLGVEYYSSAIDIWSAGCILAEMVNRQPLFNGRTEVEQLQRIFQIRGTPNETTWPGVRNLQTFVPMLPRWEPRDMLEVVPYLEPRGRNLLDRLLAVNPSNRITAEEALEHEYFRDIHNPPDP